MSAGPLKKIYLFSQAVFLLWLAIMSGAISLAVFLFEKRTGVSVPWPCVAGLCVLAFGVSSYRAWSRLYDQKEAEVAELRDQIEAASEGPPIFSAEEIAADESETKRVLLNVVRSCDECVPYDDVASRFVQRIRANRLEEAVRRKLLRYLYFGEINRTLISDICMMFDLGTRADLETLCGTVQYQIEIWNVTCREPKRNRDETRAYYVDQLLSVIIRHLDATKDLVTPVGANVPTPDPDLRACRRLLSALGEWPNETAAIDRILQHIQRVRS